jgi:hypothetical protein
MSRKAAEVFRKAANRLYCGDGLDGAGYIRSCLAVDAVDEIAGVLSTSLIYEQFSDHSVRVDGWCGYPMIEKQNVRFMYLHLVALMLEDYCL